MKKIFTILFASITLSLCALNISAQDDDPKLLKYQQKVEAANALIFSADSLIKEGEKMVELAESELKILAQEEKQLSRDIFNDRKPWEKQLRSRDREEVNQAKAELKNIDSKFKLDMKDWTARYKVSVKKYDTGNKLIDKGKTNLKKAKQKMKDAEKKLKEYEKNMDE
ncbi:MAG TPA: hypothetical protein PL017_04575 [Tenuifilaceae bacterium]|nr:hypothetical protein [Tenuifilaceae bacterium]HPE17874.1 hypothetical protein [Tenuifilaceae bacterium]HPJ45350.1 hypothetical protein [Tenuifilaceae bacterium]HPQ33591.1 hypothetical protein [Tenuifilaceae bacterium]HRX67395.1 hypothetical protein [Tenuifilaceae bacterium]